MHFSARQSTLRTQTRVSSAMPRQLGKHTLKRGWNKKAKQKWVLCLREKSTCTQTHPNTHAHNLFFLFVFPQNVRLLPRKSIVMVTVVVAVGSPEDDRDTKKSVWSRPPKYASLFFLARSLRHLIVYSTKKKKKKERERERVWWEARREVETQKAGEEVNEPTHFVHGLSSSAKPNRTVHDRRHWLFSVPHFRSRG